MRDNCGEEGDRATNRKPSGSDLASIPLPYQILSKTGTIQQVNRAWLDRLGYEREAVIGRPFVEFLMPDSVETFRDAFSTLADRDQVADVELTLRHAGGKGFTVRFEGRAKYVNGEHTDTHCQFHEIQAERDRRLQNHQSKIEVLHEVAMDMQAAASEAEVFRALVEAAEDILQFDIAIADVAEDGYLLTQAVSSDVPVDAYFDRVPIDDESKLGTRTYRSGESSLVRDLDQSDATEVENEFRSALTVPIGEYGVFQAVDREPGAFDETDLDLAELLVSHVRNALARLEHVETLRHRTASLSRERNRLAAVFEAIPEPVAHVEYEAETPTVVAVNSAFERTFGYESDAIEGRSLNELIVPPDHRESARKIDGTAATERTVEREVIRRTTEGDRTFRLRSSLLDAGVNTEALAIYVDLTEQKEREQKLKRENERLERFASIVSHDLRSPLTVASGRLDLAAETCASDHLAAVDEAIDRMDAIIDDVLTLTREGRTVEPEEREAIELAELVPMCWETVDAPAASLDVKTAATVAADRGRLRRALENLFWNAVEHAGSEVTVTVGDLEDGFYVEDDGPGIPEEDRETVFESGYTTSRDGTGLGLDIVADIVEAHGWTVELRTGTNGGARFEVRTDD
ncbi:signal transduction histidine kinase [Halodesulfurarchaeum formicicum]|uniref:histidine kinase n=1 Tax=Halodesulfurarchaeum formicicum TaxID=1873524 RepID=A0A1D8S2T5_9EURY|nr:PAS domain S-box protein [Halodesulfurarchaeum formicicum]AOW79668.1 signal transduction histidine kinase [Halodesulfurarchaeum formicicum]